MANTDLRRVVPRKGAVMGQKWAVATDNAQASLAAATMFQRGGTAGDALIAAAACNAVGKPYATQLGGDAFALIWRRRTGEVECLNAGGLAPKRATLDEYAGGIPTVGPRSVTVPGLVDALMELYAGYATLPLGTLMAPAIRLCEDGMPVTVRLNDAMTILPNLTEPYTLPLRKAYLKDNGQPYAPGEILRQPELEATFKRLVEDERDGFYAGETADYIEKAMQEYGGLLEKSDFADHLAHWHEPIKTTYAGCEIYEQALPTQGLILLEALNIVENFPMREWGAGSANATHVMVEAIKLAFADRYAYAGDPLVVESVPGVVEQLLSKEFASQRAKEIDLTKARSSYGPAMLRSDTTSFVVADEEMVIAFIQTVFAVWGSRFYIPGAGILMTNRLSGFSTDPSSPNVIAPGKRTVHTLNNFLAIRDGALVVGGGTPGADFQVQTNIQNVLNVLDWGMDIQTANDAPRWGWTHSGTLALEDRLPAETLRDLASRGHEVVDAGGWSGSGFGQLVATLPEGGLAVASDTRGEGLAIAQ